METIGFSNGTKLSVTIEDVEQFQHPTLDFRELVLDGFATGRLDVMVRALVRLGHANSVQDALAYLADASTKLQRGEMRVSVADLERRVPRAYRIGELRELLDCGGRMAPSMHLRHGSIGHAAMHDLLTDALLEPRKAHRPQPGRPAQLLMFPEVELPAEPLTLGFEHERSRRAAFRQLRTIADLWGDVAGALRQVHDSGRNLLGEDDWSGWQAERRAASMLRRSVRQMFGRHAVALEESSGNVRGQLHNLSMFTWAAAATQYREERPLNGRVLFPEIPVLAADQGLGGGRIDALEVTSIGGRSPNRRQLAVLAALAQRRFHSSGELIRYLVDVFRAPIGINVIDWKFLIGDIVMGDDEWVVPEVSAGPLSGHMQQVQRYLTLIPLSVHLATQGREDLWEPQNVALEGTVHYLFPDRLPVVHHHAMDGNQREQRFIEKWVHRFGSARRRSSVRGLYNGLIGHLVRLLIPGAGKANGKKVHANGNGAGQLSFLPASEPLTALTILESHRRKVASIVTGSHGVLEHYNGTPNASYELRYDRLLAAIDAGLVDTSPRFDPLTGGHVGCLFPDHKEATPSLHIWMHYPPRFRCFGCLRGGNIAPDSIPLDVVREFATDWRRAHEGEKGERMRTHRRYERIAEARHIEIMTRAQELLSSAFRHSPAEWYLREIRFIDPDLAYQYGAGFGSDRMIDGLLDFGFSYEELVHYGLLGFSPKISESNRLVRSLLRRGMSLDEMRREVKIKGRRERVPGLPYTALWDRVTFPLRLDGCVNNIYGRAISATSKFLLHRKMKVRGSHVLHGGFNMEVLDPDSGLGEVIVVEGVMDALTLIQCGMRNSLAMIGVGNLAITQSVAQSKRPVGVGFNIDENNTGQKKTTDLKKLLEACGHRAEVRNFTEAFFAERDCVYNDFNTWWTETQKVVREREYEYIPF